MKQLIFNLLNHFTFMKKRISIPVLLSLFIWAGCSEKDDTIPEENEESTIYHQKYDFEDLSFEDITLVYDLNDDQTNDFWLELEWNFDTLDNDYWTDITYRKVFYDHRGAYSTYNESTYSDWAVGDTVIKAHSLDWTSSISGKHGYGTNQAEDYYTYLDRLKNSEAYWAFYLTVGGSMHYGWMRVRCYLVEEFALNLKPGEPIVVGQRE